MTGIISTTPTGSESGSLSGIAGMRGLSNQYFFKSQESLATVIDTVSYIDEDEGDVIDKMVKSEKSGEKVEEKCNLETKEKDEVFEKTTTV